mmetsp:Transcript_37128/g.86586  ORF Transcript_37128/g.86586 Transcript_37128/m.86586 type:complete len:208 (-) Transcript_37128:727-1350(-)
MGFQRGAAWIPWPSGVPFPIATTPSLRPHLCPTRRRGCTPRRRRWRRARRWESSRCRPRKSWSTSFGDCGSKNSSRTPGPIPTAACSNPVSNPRRVCLPPYPTSPMTTYTAIGSCCRSSTPSADATPRYPATPTTTTTPTSVPPSSPPSPADTPTNAATARRSSPTPPCRPKTSANISTTALPGSNSDGTNWRKPTCAACTPSSISS